MTTNRVRIIAVALVVVMVVVVVILQAGLQKTTTISTSYGVPAFWADSAPFGTNTVVFSNGRSFVTYNYVSNTSKLLSPDSTTAGLNDIDSLSVSANQQYLLFHDAEANPGGVLYNRLASLGLDTTAGYWWLYTLSSQSFQPLPGSPIIAKLAGNTVSVLAQQNGSEDITTYAPADLQQTGVTNIPNAANFFPAAGGYLLETVNNEIAYAQTGSPVTKIIYKNTNLVGVDPANNQLAVGITGQRNSQKLVLLNIQTDSTSGIASGVTGQAVLTSDGTVLYTAGPAPPALDSYSIATHTNESWRFSGEAKSLTSQTLTPLTVLPGGDAFVSNSSGNTYFIGNNVAAIKPVLNTYLSVLTVDGTQVDVGYSPSEDGFEVSLSGGANLSNVQAAVYASLEASGYVPNLVSVEYVID